MVHSTYRGHKVIFVDNVWVYFNDRISVEDDPYRKCGHCKEDESIEGHDACLGTLKGIANACCGHGIINDAYVQFLDGSSLRGAQALEVMDIIKRYAQGGVWSKKKMIEVLNERFE
jgi:hypothetical protein